MAEEDDDILGRRQIDKYGALTPEVMHVLMIGLQTAVTKLEGTVEKGFDRIVTQLDQMEKRIAALEGFRERVQERDRALARAEGEFRLSWPAVAALLTFVTLVVGVVVTLLSH